MCPDLVKKAAYFAQAADVWALGVILFILVVGKLPFSAEYEADLYRKIQACKFTFPEESSDEGKDISPQAKILIRKILEQNPLKRLTTA